MAALGGILRLVGGLRATVISRDGIGYLETARLFAAGDLAGFQRHTAPGFPLLISLPGRLFGVGEPQALVLAALCGLLSVVGVALLAQRWAGRQAALLGACVAAFLPLLVELGGEVLSEPLFLATLPWTLWALAKLRGPRGVLGGAGWGLLAGALGGLGYLARPEGILVLGVGAALLLGWRGEVHWRRRAADLAWLAWPALLIVLAFMFAIRSESVLGGSQGGAWKLTLKRNLGYHLGQWTLGLGLANLGEQLRQLAKALWPLLGFGPALWLATRSWRSFRSRCSGSAPASPADLPLPEPGQGLDSESAPDWGVLQLSLATFAALLAAYVAIRPDRRYAAPLALLLLPLVAGAGARWLKESTLGRRRGLALLLVPLVGASLLLSLRPRRLAKASLRLAGEALKERGARSVLAHDSRVAYYAGAQALELIWLVPEPRTAGALAQVARDQGASALVLVVESPEEQALAERVEVLLGGQGEDVRAAGGVPLRLVWLGAQ